MSNGLPERQAVIDLYDVELGTAHSQMCSTDYKECCQPSHDEFVKALDDLIRACSRREEGIWSALAGRDQYAAGLDAAREAVAAMNDMQPSWWKAMFFGGRRARWWCQYGWDWGKRDALTVIDRLREKP